MNTERRIRHPTEEDEIRPKKTRSARRRRDPTEEDEIQPKKTTRFDRRRCGPTAEDHWRPWKKRTNEECNRRCKMRIDRSRKRFEGDHRRK
ncbi:hypothetical protein QE152_g27771 [Popillia japonica]|uniref:Uncharacterized protein n=1 Tax=Popillia japonica TaxID=7064 RepID=A0AAW1JKQ8_POPJA